MGFRVIILLVCLFVTLTAARKFFPRRFKGMFLCPETFKSNLYRKVYYKKQAERVSSHI